MNQKYNKTDRQACAKYAFILAKYALKYALLNEIKFNIQVICII